MRFPRQTCCIANLVLDGVALGDGGLFVGLGLVPADGLIVGVKAGFPPQPAMTTAKTATAT